jgi:hypothetical protein
MKRNKVFLTKRQEWRNFETAESKREERKRMASCMETSNLILILILPRYLIVMDRLPSETVYRKTVNSVFL